MGASGAWERQGGAWSRRAFIARHPFLRILHGDQNCKEAECDTEKHRKIAGPHAPQLANFVGPGQENHNGAEKEQCGACPMMSLSVPLMKHAYPPFGLLERNPSGSISLTLQTMKKKRNIVHN